MLAAPLGNVRSPPLAALSGAGTIVSDAPNYWWPVDARLPVLEETELSSSEGVRNLMPGARLARTFNHYHELDSEARAAGHPDRHALAIA